MAEYIIPRHGRSGASETLAGLIGFFIGLFFGILIGIDVWRYSAASSGEFKLGRRNYIVVEIVDGQQEEGYKY